MKIAYLNLKSHPRGNHMLQALLKTKYSPSLVIEEASTLAEKSYNSLHSELKKVNEESIPRGLEDIFDKRDIEHIIVKNHNSNKSEKALRTFKPDYIILGDTRIIKPNIIGLASRGVINVHPGYLPDVRGNNPYIWSLFHNLPSGCSVHFIDEDIDTGPVLLRQKLDPQDYSSYPHYLIAINKLCSELLVKAITQIEENGLKAVSQSKLQLESELFDTFTAASPEIKNTIKKMFLEQQFAIKT